MNDLSISTVFPFAYYYIREYHLNLKVIAVWKFYWGFSWSDNFTKDSLRKGEGENENSRIDFIEINAVAKFVLRCKIISR